MTPEDLLLDTMRDLRHRTDLRASEYDMVQASGLIRRLLLDGSGSLVHRVNRRFRMKFTCRWGRLNVAVAARGGAAWVPMHWLDPDLYLLRTAAMPREGVDAMPEIPEPREGTLRQFMGSAVVRGDGSQHVRVDQLLGHYANREGGVHHGVGPADSALLEAVRCESEEALRLTVLASARIIYRALEPLAAVASLIDEPHPKGLSISHTGVFSDDAGA